MKSKTALVVLLLLLASCTESTKEIRLTFKYKPGMVLEYKQASKRQTMTYVADSLIENEIDESQAFVKQKVLEVVNDSTFKINEIDTWHYVKVNKDDSAQVDSITYSREMDLFVLRNGKIIEFIFKNSDDNASSNMESYYEQGLPVFPSVAVYPGYSWTQSTSLILPSESMNATTTYTIKSFVRELGYDCAVIEYSGDLLIPIEPTDGDATQRSGLDKIQTKGMIYFAYIKGVVIKQTENWTTEGNRIQFINGQWERYNYKSTYDVNFILIHSEGLK